MAEENQEQLFDEEEQSKSKGKWLKIGVPVILVQIIAAYFLASYLIIPMFFDEAKANTDDGTPAQEEVAEDSDDSESQDNEFGFIFKVEDVIVNPAESRGSQFVLINIAFELKEEGDISELERREPQIRDILIRIISSKPIDQLDGPDDKEMLREEIKEPVSALLPAHHLNNVYFVNYIIQ